VKDVSKYTDYFKRLSKSSVINNVFLISRMEKFSIQHSLYVAGVNVPKSIVVSNRNPEEVLQNLKLPLYMKSQKQADTVIQINTKDEFDKKISSKSIEDFYFEESVDMENFHLEKIYYINEYAEPRNPSFIITDNLMDGLKKISHVLKLDVYSVDIFFSSNTDDYKCIDVNPSSALFYSAKARIDFVQYVLYKLANS
jgi:glutathione synthase/RimK-type ligase-like ATP-grasp enzyme